jgi:ketol-acid reductoisomerase
MKMIRNKNAAAKKAPQQSVVASIGFGSMAGAICSNLRDSGIKVLIGARNARSASVKKAGSENFDVTTISRAVKACDYALIAIPDLQIRDFFEKTGRDIFSGKCIILCHGLSFFYHPLSFPDDCDIILISPNAIANKLRENYISGLGDYALCAVLRDKSKKAAKKLKYICDGLKISKNRIIQSKLKDEVFSDLFAEQSLLVGGILALTLSSFETMCEAGLSEEAAYLSTFHEIKFIVEAMNELGIKDFIDKISDVARIGSIKAFFESGLKDKMKQEFKKIYGNIESHKFYNNFINPSPEAGSGESQYQKQLSGILNSKLCEVYERFKRKKR